MAERGKNIIGIVDAGGRGAALIDLYSRCSQVGGFVAYPGNDLMKYATHLPVEPTGIALTDRDRIVADSLERRVALLDVCQDNAVAVGTVNAAREAGIATIGHTQQAGMLESDKGWARQFLDRIGLSAFQPQYRICESGTDGGMYLSTLAEQPLFVKAAGLAEGKGALAARNKDIAQQKIIELKHRFPQASRRYLIEEWLLNDDGTPGEEFSYFILANDRKWVFQGAAQDHKPAFNYDEGENTGGMGCYSNPKVLTGEVDNQMRMIADKVVNGMVDEGRPLSGDLYLSGMVVNRDGQQRVKIIEINDRWGDPEAEAVLPGLRYDRFKFGLEADEGSGWLPKVVDDTLTRVAVTGASRGYPGEYGDVKGKRIYGLFPAAGHRRDVRIFGAGVKEVDNKFYASGGRLFYVVGSGSDIVAAREAAYGAMAGIHVEGNNLHYRTDIGHRDVQRAWEDD